MGDYVKLIVHAEVKCSIEEIESVIQTILKPTESAYHCDDSLPQMNGRAFTLAVQTKYGKNQEEFLAWLKPFIVQGSGPSSVWAMQFSEYSFVPRFYSLYDIKSDDLY